MTQANIKEQKRKSINILVVLLLTLIMTNCASRSHIGAGMGATMTTVTCLEMGVDDPYAIAICSLAGGLAGADIMYNSDYDVHYATFVDHLKTGPMRQSYTNWFNPETGSHGSIKISSSWKEGPIICTSYTGTYSIKNQWPLPGIGGVKRKTHMGVACKMPDGRYVEKPRGLGLHPDWEPIVADPNGCSYRDCNYWGEVIK